MTQKIGAALLAHAETIWRTADTLRAAGVKESEFPSYMMPFFALMLLESRLRRFKREKVAEFEAAMNTKFDSGNKDHRDWLEAAAKAANKGYHPELLLLDKGLRETCAVPGGNFRTRLMAHLDQYDPETKKLLGLGYAETDPKYLDIQGKAADLFARPNSLLYAFAQKWAAIDLTPFSNSEVTTIEEHIKRKWGDISAETAGEQYTPSDVIDLCNAVVVDMRKRSGAAADGIAKVYDMTCGGGNFLFGSEEALREAFPELSVQTFGQELNDALFALAAIEARFREDAKIAHDNTLTNDHFIGEKFDVINANPPYGGDWKDFKAAIEADTSGRFLRKRFPPTSDGQLLFLQHAVHHLADRGIATIVHNGATLFSGDAGEGESETRLWLLKDLDVVEAIIQLPKNEFFNTGISTYVWVLNRNKAADRKGHVLLINAESCSTKLKKNLNHKNCEVDAENRAKVVAALRNFADGPISRKLTLDQLLYNKVEIQVHRHDEEGRAITEETLIEGSEITVRFDEEEFRVVDGRLEQRDGLSVKEMVSLLHEVAKGAAETEVKVKGGAIARRDNESGTVWVDGEHQGVGVISVRGKSSKAKGVETAKIEIKLAPLWEKDFEQVPYSSDPKKNDKLIDDFLQKWVAEPWRKVGGTLGCEISFNRTFPKQIDVPKTAEIIKKVHDVEAELKQLETALEADLARDVR